MQKGIVVCLGLLLAGTVAIADQVWFKNGDVLTGTVTAFDGSVLTVASTVAGEVKVKVDDIATFSCEAPLEIHLKDGTVLQQGVQAGEEGKVLLAPEGALAPQPIALADFDKINPPKPKWVGSVRLGGAISRGNTERESASAGIEASRRGEQDRISASARYNYGREEDRNTGDKNTTADAWSAQGQYDYFLSDKLYWYANTLLEKDRIADLNLRVAPSIGLGYQWIEGPVTNYSTEAGLAWVYEDYDDDDDDGGGSEDNISLRLAHHLDHQLLENLLFIHNLEVFPSLEDINDYYLKADAGLRSTLTASLFAELRFELDYDSTPAEDADKADTRYILSVGWNF